MITSSIQPWKAWLVCLAAILALGLGLARSAVTYCGVYCGEHATPSTTTTTTTTTYHAIEYEMPAHPDANIHPEATGRAKAVVDSHRAEQPLKLYAGWFCPYVPSPACHA
jgi:hypothetical protein